MSEHWEGNIVCVAHADTAVEAHIWQNALEEEGIKAKVVGDFLDAGLGNIPGMKAEVWVHEDDLQKATQIIEQIKQAPPDDSEEAEESE